MIGTNWNGHRFFGLRQTTGTKAGAEIVGGKRRRDPGGASGSIEDAAALRPVGVGDRDHRTRALVTSAGSSS
jgi:hypothetical protein